ncbi:outer membrane beta-barrel protein [Plesiomonas sp.]|uniref:outer membrane beta-barrel protein n=1 Tax=Plesiomonas sp. TaxID=2486279 RepID=UPI003F2B4991
MSVPRLMVPPKIHLNMVAFLLAILAFGAKSESFSRGWYAGANIDLVNATGGCQSHATYCDNKTTGGELLIGYQIKNAPLSIEASYNSFGDIHAIYPALGQPTQSASYHAEINGITLSIKPYWVVSNNLSLFSRIGMFGWRMSVTGKEIGFTHRARDTGWSPKLEVGTEYVFNRSWSATLGYLWVNNVGGKHTGGTDLSTFNIGAMYYF